MHDHKIKNITRSHLKLTITFKVGNEDTLYLVESFNPENLNANGTNLKRTFCLRHPSNKLPAKRFLSGSGFLLKMPLSFRSNPESKFALIKDTPFVFFYKNTCLSSKKVLSLRLKPCSVSWVKPMLSKLSFLSGTVSFDRFYSLWGIAHRGGLQILENSFRRLFGKLGW